MFSVLQQNFILELLNISQTIIKSLEACCVKVIFWQMGYRYRTRNFSSSPGWQSKTTQGKDFHNQHGDGHGKALWSEWKNWAQELCGPQILWLKLSHYASKNIKPKELISPKVTSKREARQTEIQIPSPPTDSPLTRPLTQPLDFSVRSLSYITTQTFQFS